MLPSSHSFCVYFDPFCIIACNGFYPSLTLNWPPPLKGCIPTPKTLSSLKLYDSKCFYLLNDDFGGKFQNIGENPFSTKLFTEIFGDLLKNPPNISSPKIFSPKIFAPNIFAVILLPCFNKIIRYQLVLFLTNQQVSRRK